MTLSSYYLFEIKLLINTITINCLLSSLKLLELNKLLKTLIFSNNSYYMSKILFKLIQFNRELLHSN
jgi:hypothetical protein